MMTFKTYRNGNVRDENEKNANDVHLQRQRIIAFLNLYFRCISVGTMRQCVDASIWPTCKMCLYPPHSRPPPKNRHPRATG